MFNRPRFDRVLRRVSLRWLMLAVLLSPGAGAGSELSPLADGAPAYRNRLYVAPNTPAASVAVFGGHANSAVDAPRAGSVALRRSAFGQSVGTSFIPFAAQVTGLPPVDFGSVAWGDLNGDGFLDVLLDGWQGEAISRIYQNTGSSTFNEVAGATLPGLAQGTVSWADYDNDGDLDAFLAGSSNLLTAGVRSVLYRNDGASVFIEETNAHLPGVFEGAAAWGDYDNDGWTDVVLIGMTEDGPISQLWRNNHDGSFTANPNVVLPGVLSGAVAWGDIDNDGWLDLLLTGWSGGTNDVGRVYRNRGDGTFAELNAGLPAVRFGSLAVADQNNDGRIDVLVTGLLNGTTRITRVYQNTGNLTFSELPAGLPGILHGAGAWGDYDNDGWMDLLLAGATDDLTGLARVYRNNGNGTFQEIDVGLPAIAYRMPAWGDFNQDGRLDILLAGADSSAPFAVTPLYRNRFPVTNQPPSAPGGLSASVAGGLIRFSWFSAADDRTPANGLTYNLRVGLTPGGQEICSGLVNTGGRRLVPQLGNVQHGLTAVLQTNVLAGIPPGQPVYWSVQAIDSALAAGPFALEATFLVPYPCPAVAYVDDDWQGFALGVDPDGAGPAKRMGVDAFASLQQAIFAVCDGATVHVAAGRYRPGAPLQIFRNVTLQGESAANTILDGENARRVVDILGNPSQVTLANLTIQNGRQPTRGAGVAVSVSGNSPVTLAGCVLSNNVVTASEGFVLNRGGAIDVTGGDLRVIRSLFVSNRVAAFTFPTETGPAFSDGGAIHADGTQLTVIESTFTGNRAHAGGGEFQGRRALGAAIRLLKGRATLLGCTFDDNRATVDPAGGSGQADGGAVHRSDADLTVVNCTFIANQGRQGAAIFSDPGTSSGVASNALTVVNSTITGNLSERGGGVFNQGVFLLRNSIVAGNEGSSGGPEIWSSDRPVISNGANFIGSTNGITNAAALADRTFTSTGTVLAQLVETDAGGGARLRYDAGPLPIIPLVPGSLAIDAGRNADIPPDTFDLDGDGNRTEPVPFDQRGSGFDRVANSVVDLGAVEFPPPPGPSVVTLPATLLTVTGAQINGQVNPQGAPVGSWFEWGTSGVFQNRTPLRTLTAGSQAVAVSEALNNLIPGTTYAFRVVASNQFGLSRGLAVNFLTPVDRVAPALILASNNGPTRVLIHFSEPLDAISAANALNYRILGGAVTVRILSARLLASRDTVELETSDLGPETRYTVEVRQIRDLWANLLSLGSISFISVVAVAPPILTSTPAGTNVVAGSTVTFCATAASAGRLTYQWRLNGVNLPGQTNSCLTLSGVEPRDGGSYSVVIANAGGAVTSPSALLTVSLPVLLAGDLFARRVSLANPAGAIAGDNVNATREAGEPNHAGRPASRSVWYSWQAPGNGWVEFDTAGSSFDTVLAVYSGNILSNLVALAGNDDSIGSLTARVRLNVVAGGIYQIAVDGQGGARGVITFSWQFASATQPIPVIKQQPRSRLAKLGSQVTFDVLAVGTNLTYQWFFNSSPIAGATRSNYSIASVQAGHVGTYAVTVTSGTQSVRSDNARLSLDLRSTDSEPREVRFVTKYGETLGGEPLVVGRALELQGASAGGAPAPDGSLFSGSFVFSSVGAISEEGEPNHCGQPGGASVWMQIESGLTSDLHLNTDGSDFDTVLAVYRGDGIHLGSLVSVACDNSLGQDGRDSSLAFLAEAGVTYYVAVDGVNGASGRVKLNYELIAPSAFAPVSFYPDTPFRLRFNGRPNRTVRIESSADLVSWTSLLTTNAPDGVVEYADPDSRSRPMRFFRARQE